MPKIKKTGFYFHNVYQLERYQMADSRFFKNTGPYSLAEIAQVCQAEIKNCPDSQTLMIHDVRPLNVATSQDLACYHNSKYVSDLKNTKAIACLIQADDIHQAPPHLPLLVTPRPYRAYAQILGHFYGESGQQNNLEGSISSTAVIAPSAKIGKNCIISDFVVIGENTEIGDNCRIGPHSIIEQSVVMGHNCDIAPHVTISHTLLGNHITVKSGARIGQKGFGFDMDDRGHVTVPQLGRVLIGDHVEIGANTTIDRGSNGDTQIGYGCRIDNLVQIAHNVTLGDHCVLVAQVGIAGSSQLGKFVIAAGQVGIAGHLKIGNQVKIAAKSGLMRDVADGQTVAGIPAIPVREHFRQVALLSKMIQKK